MRGGGENTETRRDKKSIRKQGLSFVNFVEGWNKRKKRKEKKGEKVERRKESEMKEQPK
jgi:hypothetical protein